MKTPRIILFALLLAGWRVPWDKKPLVNAKSETITRLGIITPHVCRLQSLSSRRTPRRQLT
jgi:hypothetical protein